MVWFGGGKRKAVQDLGAAIHRLRHSQYLKEAAYRRDVHATTGEESECANVSKGKSAARQTSNGFIMSASMEEETEVAEGLGVGGYARQQQRLCTGQRTIS